jgi:hypothetical protein
MSRGGCCCHWKLLLGLAVAGLGLTLLLAPGYVLTVVPLLCVIACPLSMVLMMAFMGRGRPGMGDWGGPHEPQIAQPTGPHGPHYCPQWGEDLPARGDVHEHPGGRRHVHGLERSLDVVGPDREESETPA